MRGAAVSAMIGTAVTKGNPMEHEPVDVTAPVDVPPTRWADRRRLVVVGVATGAFAVAATGIAVAAGQSHHASPRSAAAAGQDPTPPAPAVIASSSPSSPAVPAVAPTTAAVAAPPTTPMPTRYAVSTAPGGTTAPTTQPAPASSSATTYPAHQDETISVALDGLDHVVAGQAVTYTAHVTWSAAKPGTVHVCDDQQGTGCADGLPYTDPGARTTTPPPAKAGGAEDVTKTITFAQPGTYRVTATAVTGGDQYYQGRAQTWMTVVVSAA